MTPEPSVKSLTSTNRRITPRSVDGSNRSTCVNSAACSAAVRSRLAGREQQQSTPVASSEIKPAIITGIVLASFHKLKTTILVDTESLAIKDVHFTTKRKWDGHIGLQVYRRNAEDLQEFLADANYSWSDLRECVALARHDR